MHNPVNKQKTRENIMNNAQEQNVETKMKKKRGRPRGAYSKKIEFKLKKRWENKRPTESLEELFFKAVTSGNADEVKRLVEAGANVNARNAHGYPGLVIAAGYSRVDILKYLLDVGADAEIYDIYSTTPLQWAQKNNNARAIKLLKEHINKSKPSQWSRIKRMFAKIVNYLKNTKQN